MSILRRIAKYAAQEVAKTGLAAVGQHLGDAIGTVVAKRIDKDHGKAPAPAAGDAKPADVKKDAPA